MERVHLSAVALVIVSVLLGSFVGVAGGFRVAPGDEVEVDLPSATRPVGINIEILGTLSMDHELGWEPKEDFLQGEVMFVYLFFSAQFEGESRLVLDPRLNALRIELSLISSPEDTVVATSSNFGRTGAHGSGRDSYLEYWEAAYIQIERSWPAGDYTLMAKVSDLHFGLVGTKSTGIRVIEGSPLLDLNQNPLAVEPEKLLVKLQDLEAGWAIKNEGEQGYGLYGALDFRSAYFRSFIRRKGSSASGFEISVYVLPSVAEANRYMEFIVSYLRGLGRIVEVLDVAEAGFYINRPFEVGPSWGWKCLISGELVDLGDECTLADVWSSAGPEVVFARGNVVVRISSVFNVLAYEDGFLPTFEEFLAFAEIQASKIP